MITGIFVALPIYLATGAGFGFVWSRYVSGAARRKVRAAERARRASVAKAQPPVADITNLTLDKIVEILANITKIKGARAPESNPPEPDPVIPNWTFIIIMAMIPVIAFVWLLVFPTQPAGAPFAWGSIEFASVLLGVAGGRWYARATNDRDKLIFIGSAGLLFVVASLQYDLGILNGLTKFGAGSVSVEFTPQAAKTDVTPGLADKEPFQAFPGANRLDIAISLYQQLSAFIDRDENYAQVFAGPVPGLAPTSTLEPMNMRLQDFKQYAQDAISPIANKLCFLQHYERSEDATLTLDPRLVLSLRRSYQIALDRDYPVLIEMGGNGSPVNVLQESMGHLEKEIDAEYKSLRRLSDEGVDKSDYYKECGDINWQDHAKGLGITAARLFSPVPKSDYDQNFGYFGYLAVMAATAEFAYGNHENAIQLLDREIRRESASKEFPAFPGPFQKCADADPNSVRCDEVNRANGARLNWFRRLFVIWRLEYIQNIMIDASEDENHALIPINVTTLERSIATGNLAFDHLSVDAVVKRETLEGSFDYYPTASCSVTHSENSIDVTASDAERIAVNAYSIIVDKNNELWLLATHPEMVAAEPSRIASLDRYAEEIENFDTECLSKLQVPDARIWQRRRRLLGTVVAYWEARGRRFGMSANDDERARQIGSRADIEITALCKAYKANQIERRAFEMERDSTMANPPHLGPEPDAESALDQRATDFDRHAIAAQISSAESRISTSLREYAQGDVEKYCMK